MKFIASTVGAAILARNCACVSKGGIIRTMTVINDATTAIGTMQRTIVFVSRNMVGN